MGARFVENLKDYKTAIEQEFAEDHTDVEVVLDKTRSLFVESLPELAIKLMAIAEHADKEGDSLNAIKYIYDFVFGKSAKEGNADPMTKVISELMQKPAVHDYPMLGEH